MTVARGVRALAITAAFALGAAAALAKPAVVLLSMDGVRHDYPERDALPGFARIAKDGARAEALMPVFPSITFPAHTSLSTGTYPDRHAIVNNHFVTPSGAELHYGEAAGALEAEPLWAAAERQGVRAATFFWPLSDAPSRGAPASYVRAPFDESVPESAKAEQILAWLDLPEARRPGLVMSWWHGADSPGHEHGPDSREVRDAMRAQDAELARLIAGIDARSGWSEVTLLVVSDHGMLAPGDALDANDLLEAAGVAGRAVNASALALIRLPAGADARGAARALAAAQPRIHAYTRDELPAALRFGHANAGDVVLLADPPLAFFDAWTQFDFWRRASSLWGGDVGVHGYDPEKSPEMRAIFFALGRGVPPGARLGRVRAIDVAATVARLLGIEPPAQNEGAAIAGLGTE
ncbi:MAG TPA: ectonucleotide pyrophosphatase/phosphodiesterase [Myxococcota bacterium]|nr:ectonucleotide pyrophosphatase/phosphodiesterase [Myxococcota bacterium]